jgi:hypothetical protein
MIFTPAATNPYTITASPNLTLTISGVGITNFFDHYTAGGEIFNSGQTNFFDHSNAGSALILHEGFGLTLFFDRSSAGNADIETFNAGGGYIIFNDNSTAGNAFIGVTDQSILEFRGSSTAGNAFITGGASFTFTTRPLRATRSSTPQVLLASSTLPGGHSAD